MMRKNQIIRAGVLCLLLSLNMSPSTSGETTADTITTAFKTMQLVFQEIKRLIEEAEQKAPQATEMKQVFEIGMLIRNLEQEAAKSQSLKKDLNLKIIEQIKKAIREELSLSFVEIRKIVRPILALLKSEELEELKKALSHGMILILKITKTICTMNEELVAKLILEKIESNPELGELKGALVEILDVILKDEEGRSIELMPAERSILTCIEAKGTIQKALENKLDLLLTESKVLSEGKYVLNRVLDVLYTKKALEFLPGMIIGLLKLPNETKTLEKQLEELEALYKSLSPEITEAIAEATEALYSHTSLTSEITAARERARTAIEEAIKGV